MDDYAAIQNLKARYCASADSSCEDRDAARAALLALFAPDVTADYGMEPIAGAEAVADFLSVAISGGSEWMIHNLHSPLVEIDGDGATGQWTVNVRMKRPGIAEPAFVFGRYHDAFRRVDGAWKIAAITFRRCE
ncbi:MAG: nuclear transport factor 2 family protein [Blastomonas sp.]